jgi:hypothetical protein
VASLAVPGAALADTLDQQQPNSEGAPVVFSGESLAQTFTAGLTGPLDRVELRLVAGDSSSPDSPLTIEIRDVSDGSPGTNVLATGSVPPSAVSSTEAWIPITFATAAPVAAGTQYSIVAYSSVDSAHRYGWGVAFSDAYPAGASFTQVPPSSTWVPTAFPNDQAFKTYVEVPAPPAGQPPAAKKKCKKHKKKHKRSAESAKKKKCKKKKRK